jgi:hypothetical protein
MQRELALLHTELLRLKAACLAIALDQAMMRIAAGLKAYDPAQPRVPAGNSDGGQWVGGNNSASVSERTQRIRLAAQISAFTKHGINQAISRGVSPAAIQDAIKNPKQILPQDNGTIRYIGEGAVVVLNPAGSVVTVWGQ